MVMNGVDFGEDSWQTYGSLTSSLVEVFWKTGAVGNSITECLQLPYEPLEINFSNDTMLCSGAN